MCSNILPTIAMLVLPNSGKEDAKPGMPKGVWSRNGKVVNMLEGKTGQPWMVESSKGLWDPDVPSP